MATFQYFPHTQDDIRAMLERIGVSSMDDLYSDVPKDYIYKGEYDLPDAMSEQEVRDFFRALMLRTLSSRCLPGRERMTITLRPSFLTLSPGPSS